MAKPSTDPEAAGSSQWEATTFAHDRDGNMAAKFKRLMGIKNAGNDPFHFLIKLYNIEM